MISITNVNIYPSLIIFINTNTKITSAKNNGLVFVRYTFHI